MAKRKRYENLRSSDPESGMKRQRKTTKDGHRSQSSLLALPAELRNEIYGMVVQDHRMWLRKGGNIICVAPILGTNRQLRSEVTAVLPLRASAIHVIVDNFRYNHLVTFLNRLDNSTIRHLARKDWNASQQLHIDLMLTVPPPYGSEELRRWLKRLEHSTKRGTQIVPHYNILTPPADAEDPITATLGFILTWRAYLDRMASTLGVGRARTELEAMSTQIRVYQLKVNMRGMRLAQERQRKEAEARRHKMVQRQQGKTCS